MFLQALAAQLAAAQERARLAQEAARLRERDRRQVRAELAQLRPLLGRDRLVYRSAAMEEVLATVRQVAGSDATVLITGESGTGKELVAASLDAAVRAGPAVGDTDTETDSLSRARDLLLAEVLARAPAGSAAGPALMGITRPTFAKWADRVRSRGASSGGES